MKLDIWNVTVTDAFPILLWKTDDNNFRVVEDGKYTDILDRGLYTLIHQKFLPVLQTLTDQLEYCHVTITDFQLKTETNEYIELLVKNDLDLRNVESHDSSGKKIWKYGSHIFVSGELKKTLAAIDPAALEFIPGVGHFGG